MPENYDLSIYGHINFSDLEEFDTKGFFLEEDIYDDLDKDAGNDTEWYR